MLIYQQNVSLVDLSFLELYVQQKPKTVRQMEGAIVFFSVQ